MSLLDLNCTRKSTHLYSIVYFYQGRSVRTTSEGIKVRGTCPKLGGGMVGLKKRSRERNSDFCFYLCTANNRF